MTQDLEERVDLMKREIDALQLAAIEKKKPWYRDTSTIISVIALMFSFGTTFVSYRHTEIQDIENLRQELRGLLQRLAALPKENVETAKAYKDDLATAGQLSGYLNQENALLSRQAGELAKKLPRGTVSPTEYYAIGIALGNSYNLDGEREFLKLAIENAKDFNDEIGALRTTANLEFISGHPEAGRVDYQEALNIFSKYPGFDPYTIASTHIWTELAWAGSEATMGTPSQAAQHIQSAEAHLSKLVPSPGAEMLRLQVAQAKAQYERSETVGAGTDQPQIPTAPLKVNQ